MLSTEEERLQRLAYWKPTEYNYIRKNFPLEPNQRIFKVRIEPSIKKAVCTCTKPALHTVLTRINDKRMHRMIDLMAEFCQECFEKNVEIVH